MFEILVARKKTSKCSWRLRGKLVDELDEKCFWHAQLTEVKNHEQWGIKKKPLNLY